jgi:glycosyltransferase involved in cell wall biosynthesis
MSVINQTIPPSECVVVDNDSSDGTYDVCKKFNSKVKCVNISLVQDIADYRQAISVMEGVKLATLMTPNWKYLLKQDADVELAPNYVESLISEMEKDHDLGICVGYPPSAQIIKLYDSAKLYKRNCWDQIKGLQPSFAYDIYAVLLATQSGWKVKIIPEAHFKDLRPSRFPLSRWVTMGLIRRAHKFPLAYTVSAAFRTVIYGYPFIIGPIAMVIAHMLSPYRIERLNPKQVKRYALDEIKMYWNQIFGKNSASKL